MVGRGNDEDRQCGLQGSSTEEGRGEEVASAFGPVMTALEVSEGAIVKTTIVDACGICLSCAERGCIFLALGGNLPGN